LGIRSTGYRLRSNGRLTAAGEFLQVFGPLTAMQRLKLMEWMGHNQRQCVCFV